MSIKDDGKQNSPSAKVLQLGFNISVSGDPGTDFQIVLDDKGQKGVQSSQNDVCLPSSGILPINYSDSDTSKKEFELNTREVESINKTAKVKSTKETSPKSAENFESSSGKELNIIDEIKSTLEHFEKFSDHLKDVPRLRCHPAATSTPKPDKNFYKSDSNLTYSDYKQRRYSHLYDYTYKKNYYFNKPPKPPDLFLKPLPGESFYRSGFNGRFNFGSMRHYVSDSSLNKTTDYEKSKYDDLTQETTGILKKIEGECGDRQSTSSGESIKDIKIYQSGGILIMQNFKDNMDGIEKSDINHFNAQLLEQLTVLKDDPKSPKNKGGCIEEGRSGGKMVQFDLSGFESQKSRSGDSSSVSPSKDEKSSLKQGSSDSISDSQRNKDSPPQGTSQSQDFPSLSTVENESTVSNQFGLSPTYSSTKKLEWDSGADVGYSDPSKENLSSIEKFVLSNLSSNILDESSLLSEFSKFIHVKEASDKLMDEIRKERSEEQKQQRILKEIRKEKNEPVNFSDIEAVKNSELGSSKESNRSKPQKVKPLKQVLTNKPVQKEARERKPSQTIDKSVNVNTLFENENLNPSHENITPESYRNADYKKSHRILSPKFKKHRRSYPSPRKITWAPKKRTSFESPPKSFELPLVRMGVPKKTYKKVDGNPEIRDIELSREVGEIVIDQRFKIKQNVTPRTEVKKPAESKQDNGEKENKPKRPVSGSSSSNNTVLPNIEAKEKNVNKYSDQIIQTVVLDSESIGVQAFESQKSSACNSKKEEHPEKGSNVKLSSKNTQAFGSNASLPKQLAHPKNTQFSKNQCTKGTQFFGERNNSLPMRFASPGLISSLRVPGAPPLMSNKDYLNSLKSPNSPLNTKTTSEAELIRVNEENQKNIEASDSSKTNSRKSGKNKENEISENIKSQSQKTKSSSTPEKKVNEGSDKKLPIVDDPEYVHTSDDVSSKVLTSEVLKEHGDSIDRNIIKEKYFQSQLVELKKREMVTRSTSIDSQIEGAKCKECATVACQYSSRSNNSTSKSKTVREDDCKDESKRSRRTETTDQYDSSHNMMQEELINSKTTNQRHAMGDSLPSSTHTANSWVVGGENPEKDKTGVGRTTSFEYLPGHVYENSGNLREELPSETEQNLTTTSSSGSDFGKHSANEGGKDSEGRNTLILENSTDNSHESDQLKILDENLTQLNLIVSKLWEKEVQVKNLNESLFVKLCDGNGSGDHLGPTDSLQTEVLPRGNCMAYGKERGDCEIRVEKRAPQEISISCQTEDKSSSEQEKFYGERKELQERISEEKECQIKWIENEIRHLNVLRQLLETQSLSRPRKKRHSLASESLSISKTDKDDTKIRTRSVTPSFGCTISLSRNSPFGEIHPQIENNTTTEERPNDAAANPDSPQYGMSVSLKNIAMNAAKNFQRIVALPVGVQISLKGNSSEEIREHTTAYIRQSSSRILSDAMDSREPSRDPSIIQNHVSTQFPSSMRTAQNYPSTSVQTDCPNGICDQHSRRECYYSNSPAHSMHAVTHTSRRESLKSGLQNDGIPVENKINGAEIGRFLNSRLKCPHKNNECGKEYDRVQSPSSKSFPKGIICQPCKSNVPSNPDGASIDFPSCHCSKVQVHKYSTCVCQIIKILGGKTLRDYANRKSLSKNWENQSSQTEEAMRSRDFIRCAEASTMTRGPQMVETIDNNCNDRNSPICMRLSREERRGSLEKHYPNCEKGEGLRMCPMPDAPLDNKLQREVDARIDEKVEKIARAIKDGWKCPCFEAFQREACKENPYSLQRKATKFCMELLRSTGEGPSAECDDDDSDLAAEILDEIIKIQNNLESLKKKTVEKTKDRCRSPKSHSPVLDFGMDDKPVDRQFPEYECEPDATSYTGTAGDFSIEALEEILRRPNSLVLLKQKLAEKKRERDMARRHTLEMQRVRDENEELLKDKPDPEYDEYLQSTDTYDMVTKKKPILGKKSKSPDGNRLHWKDVRASPDYDQRRFSKDSYHSVEERPRRYSRDSGQSVEDRYRRPSKDSAQVVEDRYRKASKDSPPVVEDRYGKFRARPSTDMEREQRRYSKDSNQVAEDTYSRTSRGSNQDNDNDIPRHYFLKIEETEVDESSESLDKPKPVEVITVKVPVKRTGKKKVFSIGRTKSKTNHATSVQSLKDDTNLCVCCKNCTVDDPKCRENSPSKKIQAERPHSPSRASAPRSPAESSERFRLYSAPEKYEIMGGESNRPEYFNNRSITPPENLYKSDNQVQYDSHRKSRGSRGGFLFEHRRQEKQVTPFVSEDNFQVKDNERIYNPEPYYNSNARRRDDEYNYDKREYKTKSELQKEEEKKKKILQPNLQESLRINRPNFYNNAEKRRHIINEKVKDRMNKQKNKKDFLINLMQNYHVNNPPSERDEKRLFTSAEMREQTMKKCRDLPENVEKITDQKKKQEQMTNKILAEIYSKKLQIEVLKGHVNLSNSTSVLAIT